MAMNGRRAGTTVRFGSVRCAAPVFKIRLGRTLKEAKSGGNKAEHNHSGQRAARSHNDARQDSSTGSTKKRDKDADADDTDNIMKGG